MPNIGPMELIIVLVIVLLIFGAKRLPELGKSLGSGMREFKDSVSGKDKDDDDRVTANAALPRGDGEDAPLTGETVRESTPR
jgi:sec-independent protein translocase protein TatA